MVSSVVSNPNERLVSHRVDEDVESRDETLLSSRKSKSRVLAKRLVTLFVVLFFLAGVSVATYFLVNKYKSLNEFKSKLNEHLTKEFPNLEKEKRDTCFNELTKLFKDGLISKDPKLEYEVYREFEMFNSTYKRTHLDDKERRNRLVTFRDNYLEVKNQKGDEPYTKAINRFSDLSEKEFNELFKPMTPPKKASPPPSYYTLSFLSNITYLKNLKLAKNTTEDLDLSKVTGENLDWRRADTVSPVKDQMNCGGCWAFSTVGSVESFYLTHKDERYDLSEQELLDCDKYSNGCKGGFPETALEYVVKNGLVSSKDLPFVDRANVCSVPKTKKVRVGEFFVHKGRDVVNKSLVLSPSVVYLAVSPELSKYKSGVFTGKCGFRLNHAVLLVGEGYDEKLDKRYWVVKNSWGKDWGEDGYLRLERTDQGTDKCGVLDTGLTPYSQ